VRDALASDPDVCVLHLSVHSFTGEFDGRVREMTMGVMLDPDRILERYVADHLLTALHERGVNAVENQPYDGRADAIVTAFRPEMGDRSYAGIEVEVSQNHLDEIGDLGRRLLGAVAWLLDTH
jgi:predicted N-formylglutamate amidohydrolase